MSALSTFSPDPFDEQALRAVSRLVAPENGPLLVCGDVAPSACQQLSQSLSQSVHCLSFRHDVSSLHRADPADPFVDLNLEAYPQVVVLQRKSKPRTLAILDWLDARIQANSIVLVGHKKRGIKSMPKALRDRWPGVDAIGNANHCTAIRLSRRITDTPKNPVSAVQSVSEMTDAGGRVFTALPGVFGSRGLDGGTAELLSCLPKLPTNSRILDVGCGTGILGFSQISESPGSKLVAVDSDWFAVQSALNNAESAGLHRRVEIVWGDTYPAGKERFDRIVTNPPFHSGSARSYEVAQRLIREAPARLIDGGELWLVANRFLPYPEFLDESFTRWEQMSENPKYAVYKAVVSR